MVNRGDEVQVEGFGWGSMVAGSVIRGHGGNRSPFAANQCGHCGFRAKETQGPWVD